jgi:hypothetical protein
MMFLFLYFVLLVAWLPLVWPMLRLRGWPRAVLALVVVAGLLATLHEIRMFLSSSADIRLDILLIATALVGLYALAAVVLFVARWRRTAGLLGLVLLLIGGGMAYEWIALGRESDRVREAFDARNALLFGAMFRDPETYEGHFGPFTAAPGGQPVGHWQAEGDRQYTRLIVNAEGRVWLFYRCSGTECALGPAGTGVRTAGDGAEETWEATLTPHVGAPLELRITRDDTARLSLEIRGRTIPLARTPPPLGVAPAQEALVFLGAFTKVICQSAQHARVRQLWLWREQGRLHAVGVFTTLLAGRRADFVSPIVLGQGVKEGEAWRFEWTRNRQTWRATVSPEGDRARLVLAAEQVLLDGAAVFRDETIDLAPLTTQADWEHWFAVVFTGQFLSAEVPAC